MSEETDEYGRRGPTDVKQISRGKGVPRLPPKDASSYLAGSNHPYAPFTGNALKWASNVYDDTTTYEGLVREGIPHNKGVMWIGNFTGAGFQHPNRGDRYEGEFHSGFAHGLGMYTSHDGEVYRGEFQLGKRNGCGASINMKPYYDLVEAGVDAGEAWERAKPEIEANTLYATWRRDFVAGGIGGGRGRFCSLSEIKRMLKQVNTVVTRARMFAHKPDGDVNIFMLQDALGVPVTPFQDPLHYPHGTKYLAPGPMGQCHPIPDDPLLRAELAKHTRNHLRIWNMFNFTKKILPGSDMAKAIQRWRRIMKKRLERKKRIEEAERRRIRRLERLHGVKPSAQKEAGKAPKPKKRKKKVKPSGPDDDGGDFDDSDLVASTAALDLGPAEAPSEGLGSGLGSGLGALGASMSRAAGAAGAVLEAFAERAPRRRSLMRPMPCC
ncbi:hypothetical protein WJX81_002998 [Elliptochloris bilobata]|uniref:MORN repeat-containing protein 5 n=1 Tax=Elliptochloris bilobata TaxID=381761 RepID=A0AAW1RJK5_9CHLO